MIKGDQIAVLLSGGTPLILREAGAAHILIGDAYFHGIMRGEALGMDESALYKFCTITETDLSQPVQATHLGYI